MLLADVQGSVVTHQVFYVNFHHLETASTGTIQWQSEKVESAHIWTTAENKNVYFTQLWEQGIDVSL